MPGAGTAAYPFWQRQQQQRQQQQQKASQTP